MRLVRFRSDRPIDRRPQRSSPARALKPAALSLWLCALIIGAQCEANGSTLRANPEDRPLAVDVRDLVEHEANQKNLGAIAIVAIDRGEVVLSEGYGLRDIDRELETNERTPFRVGSVSKLFTDLALMRLVQARKVDLDKPVSHYLPAFQPENPFGTDITVRMLASHRSGLVREPPAGNYFDDSDPGLRATVSSLNKTRLIYPPGTRKKYSNAALAVIGRLIEEVSGDTFEDHIQQTLLQPLGMDDSSFDIHSYKDGVIAQATMWSHDGRRFEAPTFPLGMAPAGDLVSNARDIGRFLLALDRRGAPVLDESIFAEMTQGQFGDPDGSGLGIGFVIGSLDGHKTIGHGGAIYGFSTSLIFLPNERVGCAVFSSTDLSNAVTERISNQVVRWLIEAQQGKGRTPAQKTEEIDPERARLLDGIYLNPNGKRVSLQERDGRLFAEFNTTRAEVRALNNSLVVDDRHINNVTVGVGDQSISIGGEVFARTEDALPAKCPEPYLGLVGEYGFDHNVLFVYERGGELHALVEWFEIDRLEDLSDDRFRFTRGMYHGENLEFIRGKDGKATEAILAGVRFPRRTLSDEGQDYFAIEPIRPVPELRKEALSATPPEEAPPEEGPFHPTRLVNLAELDATIAMDIRYATTRNFMNTQFYTEPRAFLQADAAAAVVRVQLALKKHGLGLKIHDGYRPWHVTKMFFDATPKKDRHFVADPEKGSRHNRGCAVDLTLIDAQTGIEVGMGGLYDEMTERSYPDYPVATDRQRWYRNTLRRAMEDEGFRVYAYEWWHFDFNGWERYRIGNARFEDL